MNKADASKSATSKVLGWALYYLLHWVRSAMGAGVEIMQ